MRPRQVRIGICTLLFAIAVYALALPVLAQPLNKLKSVNYAWQHASTAEWRLPEPDGWNNSAYDPSFLNPWDTTISDCTDFVSQCMHVGGLNEIDGGLFAFYWSYNWFFHDAGHHDYSYTWAYAPDLMKFLKQSGWGYFVDPWQTEPGDVIFADWGHGEGVSHTMLVTKNDKNGNLALTQHSPNRLNKPYT